jgi:tetratricopeptide (TPR) repeat protein
MCQSAAKTLEKSRTPGALRLQSRVLAWQGVINRHMDRGTLARHLAEESLALLGRLESSDQHTRQERAAALRDLGFVTAQYQSQGADLQEALRLLKESLVLCRALGDRWETAHVLYAFGNVFFWTLYDLAEAQAFFQESLDLFRELGDQRMAAYPLALLAAVAADRGKLDEGERLAQESLAIHRQADDRHIVGLTMRQLAKILYAQGKNFEAQLLVNEEIGFCEDLGIRRSIAESHGILGQVKLHFGQYEDARSEAAVSPAIVRLGGVVRQSMLPVGLLGQVELAEGAYAQARVLLHDAVAKLRESGARDWTSACLSLLAVSYYRLGQSAQARRHLAEALQITAEFRLYYALVFALPATALFLSGQGEPERAVELYALALRMPMVANSRWFEDVVGKNIAAAAAALPPEAVAAAQERGRARDLWVTAEELSDELRG